MILFPHCKINLGLRVAARRPDGYHDIETLFYPVRGLRDAVEVLRNPETPGTVEFSGSGLTVDCPPDRNLCVKAFELMRANFPERITDGVKIHLHKTIPFGAGLGGGSADATAVLQAMNGMYELNLSMAELESLAGQLGSDTVFFLHDQPMLGTGRGEQLEPYALDLSGWRLVLVKPDVKISTAGAYSLVEPQKQKVPLPEILKEPLESWKVTLVNDFEKPLFERFPVLGRIKSELYNQGAVYASMSGSGSTVFGLFRSDIQLDKASFEGCFVHREQF